MFRPTRDETLSLQDLKSNGRFAERQMRRGDSIEAILSDPLAGKLDHVFGFDPLGVVVPGHIRTDFKSIAMAPTGFDDNDLRHGGKRSIHDDGAFIGVIPGHLGVQVEDDLIAEWRDIELTVSLLSLLSAYWVLCMKYGIVGEVIMRVGIDPWFNCELLPTTEQANLQSRGGTRRLERSIEVSINVDVADIRVGPALLQTAKPILDDLFSGFCWPECPIISLDGRLCRPYVAPSLVQSAAVWTTAVSAEWSAE